VQHETILVKQQIFASFFKVRYTEKGLPILHDLICKLIHLR